MQITRNHFIPPRFAAVHRGRNARGLSFQYEGDGLYYHTSGEDTITLRDAIKKSLSDKVLYHSDEGDFELKQLYAHLAQKEPNNQLLQALGRKNPAAAFQLLKHPEVKLSPEDTPGVPEFPIEFLKKLCAPAHLDFLNQNLGINKTAATFVKELLTEKCKEEYLNSSANFLSPGLLEKFNQYLRVIQNNNKHKKLSFTECFRLVDAFSKSADLSDGTERYLAKMLTTKFKADCRTNRSFKSGQKYDFSEVLDLFSTLNGKDKIMQGASDNQDTNSNYLHRLAKDLANDTFQAYVEDNPLPTTPRRRFH